MDQRTARHYRLPGDPSSPGAARRIVRETLVAADLSDLADDALLLTSELAENAVLHAGTGFDLDVTVAEGRLTVAVTDHGSTAMELRRASPDDPDDRRSTHNRGLLLVDALSVEWGSRHGGTGHQVWFTLGTPAGEHLTRQRVPLTASAWPDVPVTRWLMHLPAARLLPLPAQVTELIRRLCDVLAATGAAVYLDEGDGEQELARYGRAAAGRLIIVDLPLTPPRKGRLRIRIPRPPKDVAEVVELAAQRIALAVETDRVRGTDQERWSWLAFLSEASELLTQSLDVQMVAAMLPQIVVPRLGRWCAVHLRDDRGQLQLVALTHLDENELPLLTVRLDEPATAVSLAGLFGFGTDSVTLPAPIEGIAVPLRIRGTVLGTLSVGRRGSTPHTPEEGLTIAELGRRAASAIDNAQRNAMQLATSQALQAALLPRALPVSEHVEFAALYQPVSTEAEVGGDYYDVLEVDRNRWLLCVGDVCGKGPRAAARTSLVRDVLRVLVREGHPLHSALELLNEMMLETGDPEQFATMACALVTRAPAGAGLDVTLVLAGHEQPTLVRADGQVDLVGQHGTPLGLVSGFSVEPTRHRLRPGDALLLYTDGITEHRKGTEQFGQQRVAGAMAPVAGATAQGQLTALRQAVEEFSADQRDDIVIMVVRALGE